ncbi:sigma-G-dependent sporulation-specific acid-soluble spore protein CsgA [Bacillus sp. T33-2]|uniref:sigma-G-dependent sporulation-specific acid-soluble spore protein CsgA n=1 Tax=Bacillus sp. T33-2 TaxID=2054168 RepID=UPI000C7793CE|nr:sigma-G-dependent sporulation-specific acid-soluble spore protein CsgA [Bacillus sp. T33-2]PLR98763.1 sporulation protein [Bacillus sp. T33-2]
MDQTLGYLREILANYTEEYPVSKHLYDRIDRQAFSSEGEFVRTLSYEESRFLNHILQEEIRYSNEERDEIRARQLNEVYELLI